MTKRKALFTVLLFTFLVVLMSITAFAASYGDTNVSVKIKTSTGTRNVTTTVGKVFNYTETNGGYTITGVKKFDAYDLPAIQEIHIPSNATEVNLTSANTYITSVIFDSGCKVKVSSLTGLKVLNKISIASNTTLSFAASCTSTTIQTIDVVGKNNNISFEASAFKDRKSLKNINFGENNKYTFKASCFQNIGASSLSFNDESTFDFSGASAFASCLSLKNLYLGKGTERVINYPFDNCPALDIVYVDGAIEISDNTFRCSSATCKIKVYVHTTKQVKIGASAFSGRSNYGALICVLEPVGTSFNSCKYELYTGIIHAQTPKFEGDVCYNAFVTDCPCGRITNALCRYYASGQNGYKEITMLSGVNPDVPHNYSGVHFMEYANGIDKAGVVERKCGVCGEKEGITRNAPALVAFAGYSVSESNNKAIVVGIFFDAYTMTQYSTYTGEYIDYGVVLSSKDALNGNNPLKENGAVYAVSVVYKYNMAYQGFYDSSLKLSGIADVNKEIIMSGYIKIGGKYYYIDNGGVSEKVTGVTYTQLIG